MALEENIMKEMLWVGKEEIPGCRGCNDGFL